MKLRFRGDSIRLRLLRSEVDVLAATGRLSETVRFGADSEEALGYTVVVSSELDEITASLGDNEIVVTLPADKALAWASGDAVSLEASQAIGDGRTLSILVEKDFVCIDREDDPDRDDAFPNPNITC